MFSMPTSRTLREFLRDGSPPGEKMKYRFTDDDFKGLFAVLLPGEIRGLVSLVNKKLAYWEALAEAGAIPMSGRFDPILGKLGLWTERRPNRAWPEGDTHCGELINVRPLEK